MASEATRPAGRAGRRGKAEAAPRRSGHDRGRGQGVARAPAAIAKASTIAEDRRRAPGGRARAKGERRTPGRRTPRRCPRAAPRGGPARGAGEDEPRPKPRPRRVEPPVWVAISERTTRISSVTLSLKRPAARLRPVPQRHVRRRAGDPLANHSRGDGAGDDQRVPAGAPPGSSRRRSGEGHEKDGERAAKGIQTSKQANSGPIKRAPREIGRQPAAGIPASKEGNRRAGRAGLDDRAYGQPGPGTDRRATSLPRRRLARTPARSRESPGPRGRAPRASNIRESRGHRGGRGRESSGRSKVEARATRWQCRQSAPQRRPGSGAVALTPGSGPASPARMMTEQGAKHRRSR